MNRKKHPFTFNSSNELNITEYAGSDGFTVDETFQLYLLKCEEFKAKAGKYRKNNLCTKNSTLHLFKQGYESSKELEEEILLKREKQMMHYKSAFDVASFHEEPNSTYECFSGESKRIRVIRELDEEWCVEFSDDFDKKTESWFTRYCILSRFIEAARKIIFLNRLQKILANFRSVTSDIIKVKNEVEISENSDDKEKPPFKTKPCTLELKQRCCSKENSKI